MGEHVPDIEAELKRMETELYQTAQDYRLNAKDAAGKRATYDVEYAKAILNIRATASQANAQMKVAEMEALAVKSVEDQLTDARIAEAMADGTKKHLDALQSILSSIQTRARLLVTERSLA
jgi:folylpolyglutamate synthase/dihydropteroate synthase